jgi:aryl-alcohol dehydrogenase-like predicted oxidoreductase
LTLIPQIRLGRSAVAVSALGVGTGTFGRGLQSQQSRQDPVALGALLRHASDRGITWWDTSDDYGTHPHVRAGLEGVERASVQISSKTHAASASAARASLEAALAELGTSFLDLYFMHDMDHPGELERRIGAHRELCRARAEGLIRAVALSTHNIDTLEACVAMEGLDVVMTNFNRHEDHMDAGVKHYAAALEAHHVAGHGVLVMKAVGEGRLAHVAADSILWNLTRPFIHAVLVGVDDADQLDRNAATATMAFAQLA